MWQERRFAAVDGATPSSTQNLGPLDSPNPKINLTETFSVGFDDDLATAVVPPVTVVLEGRSICHRISLHKHGGYQSLARALRQMFVDIIIAEDDDDDDGDDHDRNSDSSTYNHKNNVDLSNAVPGHIIAYEDMENDLLLVGDLNWKDFVRVTKRIRILPRKTKSRKQNN